MVLALVASAFAAPPDAAAQAATSGAWRLAEPRSTVQARVDAAIESMLAPFNVVVRGIARPRLTTAATFCDAYHTTVTATSIAVSCDGRPTANVTFDRPPVAGTSADGRAFSATGTWDGAAVVLTFTADEGGQRVRYQPTDGGLVVEKTLIIERLDTKLTWAMRYAR